MIGRALICGCLAVMVGACDGGRQYPPGYTDEGVKFEEDDWRFFEAKRSVSLMYFGTGSSDPVIHCGLSRSSLIPGSLSIRSVRLEPLQQWPQPALKIVVGGVTAERLPSLTPGATSTSMKVEFKGREKGQLLNAIESGDTITIAFDDQTFDIPGVPQSMRKAFAEKCRNAD